MLTLVRRFVDDWCLPALAKQERRRDRGGSLEADPGHERVIRAGIEWLGRAQDESRSADGGVARDYSLITGWATSYPETTGYIVPTMLDFATRHENPSARERARRMLDWLVEIQLPGGGFQGGRIDSKPVVPVTFNTGQILLGLAAGQVEFGDYEEPMVRAADWLVSSQDEDGCWRRHPTPFAARGEKAYETHVAWGLFEADRVVPERGYGDAGLRQVRWALTKQRANGWFESCCLDDPTRPLTHTLGYTLRGVLEAYRSSGDSSLLEAARRTGDGLLGALRQDGGLPGRLRPDWSPGVDWVCLTGSAQVAHCWLLLYQWTSKADYREAAVRANAFVRRTIRVDGPPDTRGGVKGSFPVDGDYGRYQYLNWAVKFVIDSTQLECEVTDARSATRRSISTSTI
jgi:Squalene-hopene cyclase C-terminal domain